MNAAIIHYIATFCSNDVECAADSVWGASDDKKKEKEKIIVQVVPSLHSYSLFSVI